MRRSTVLSLLLQLGFPAEANVKKHIYPQTDLLTIILRLTQTAKVMSKRKLECPFQEFTSPVFFNTLCY